MARRATVAASLCPAVRGKLPLTDIYGPISVMRSATPWAQAVETIARHTAAIGAGWANHECAAKQFGGYSFGTYLPPLLTDASAKAVAANAAWAQAGLNEWFARLGSEISFRAMLRMIGMRMGNYCTANRKLRIDIKIARFAI